MKQIQIKMTKYTADFFQSLHLNQESGKRQYALKQQAIELGWPRENIIVIDGQGVKFVSYPENAITSNAMACI